MVRHKAFSILFAIIFLCIFIVPVSAESTHPFEPYMPTPIHEDNVPASAVFVYYCFSTGEGDRFYNRYMYSTSLNNNLVYEDTPTPRFLFNSGKYFSFVFSGSNSVWSHNGIFDYNNGIFVDATLDWILENALIYCNVDIVDADGDVLFERNSQIIDGRLVPNDYTEVPEAPDYDTWYDNIFSGITNWFSGVLEVLATPFTAIADGLNGVWQAVINLADTIKEDLKSLFIPSVNILPLIFNKFADKFPIINQVVDLFSSLYNLGTDEPVFKITYNGMTLKIVDFTMFSDYLPLIRNFTGVFLLLSFLTREVRKLPRLLRGRD